MKNYKLSLSEIKINSFVIIDNHIEKQTIIGASISNSTMDRYYKTKDCIIEGVKDWWYWIAKI